MENDISEPVALVYQTADGFGWEFELRGRNTETWGPYKISATPASPGVLRAAIRQGREFCQRLLLDELRLGDLRFTSPWTVATWQDFQSEIAERLGTTTFGELPRMILEEFERDATPSAWAIRAVLWREVVQRAYAEEPTAEDWQCRALAAEKLLRSFVSDIDAMRNSMKDPESGEPLLGGFSCWHVDGEAVLISWPNLLIVADEATLHLEKHKQCSPTKYHPTAPA